MCCKNRVIITHKRFICFIANKRRCIALFMKIVKIQKFFPLCLIKFKNGYPVFEILSQVETMPRAHPRVVLGQKDSFSPSPGITT